MLTYETIMKIHEEEQNSPKLTSLPENFFHEIRDYLEKKEEMSREKADKWEIESIKRRIDGILEIRIRKILNMAFDHVRSGFLPKNMSPNEEKFFNKIVEEIKGFRKDQENMMESQEEKKVVVTILEDTPQFVGINLKVYGPFKKGEIANLPEPNAQLLIENKSAELIRIK